MKISDLLLAKEKILWQGAPKKGMLLTRIDIFLIPFSLIWGGFILFWEYNVLSAPKAPPIMALFGLPFVAVGIYVIFGRFLIDAWTRKRTDYIVTNQRIIIIRAAPFGQTTILNLNQLSDINMTEKSDHSGTIRFGRSSAFNNNRGLAAFTPSLDPVPQFLYIPRAADVFNLIQKTSYSNAI